MKKLLFILTLAYVFMLLSCKKDITSCGSCTADNKPPIANAGNDQSITLSTSNVLVDGSASTDDGEIIAFKWAQITGPDSSSIIHHDSSKTIIKVSAIGDYLFELTVTDNGGLSAKDTMQVTVSDTAVYTCGDTNRIHINAKLIPVGTLSQTRVRMAVASTGNKILFAGGLIKDPYEISYDKTSSRVDIYDIPSNSWSTAELCIKRYDIAAVATGNKVFFGGGGEYEPFNNGGSVDSVDIYDVSSNTWQVAHLSAAGRDIAAAAVGDKVFFAGGDAGVSANSGIPPSSRVDIYDLSTKTWSRAVLSEPRSGITAVTANNKIYFAGGSEVKGGYWPYSNKIDIYDNATGIWSTDVMREEKIGFAGINAGDKIYWAGGYTGTPPVDHLTCSVEIKDILTGSSAIQQLSHPTSWLTNRGMNAVMKNGKIIFMGELPSESSTNKFDIYEIATNTWSIGVLPLSTFSAVSIISVNNTIYIAGGYVNGVLSNQVWKLEF